MDAAASPESASAACRRIPLAVRFALLAAALLGHVMTGEVSVSRFFPFAHAPTQLGSLACTPLKPTAGAVAYWPLTTLPHVRPPANPAGVEGVWRAELCAGDAHALFPSGMQRNPAEYVSGLPAGTRMRCVGASCRGALVIQRVAGCPVAPACHSGRARPPECVGPAFAEPPPRAAVEDAWDLGPDELFVIFEGAEFLRLRGVHVGGCRYIFSYEVSLPGAYRIFALALRSDWQALNETGATTLAAPDRGPAHELSRFPPYTLDNILGEKHIVFLGGLEGPEGASVADEARAAAVADAQECAGENALPTCDAVAPPGRWVRKTSTAHDFDAGAPTWNEASRAFEAPHHGLGIRYFSPIRESVAWTPYACCKKPLHKARVSACLSNTSVVLRGDSQMRDLFNTFINTACGNEEKAVTHGDDLCTHMDTRCAGWHACYRSDVFGESLPTDHSDPMCLQPNYAPNSGHFHDPRCETPAWVVPPGPESAVVNFGQWSSSGSRQNSLALWALEVTRYAGMATQAQSPRVFWLDLSPYPQGNFFFYHNYRDWRTSHRLELFHAIATRTFAPLAAQGKIAGVIPRWEIINPILDATSADGAHPSHPDMLYNVAERIIVALCGADVRADTGGE